MYVVIQWNALKFFFKHMLFFFFAITNYIKNAEKENKLEKNILFNFI